MSLMESPLIPERDPICRAASCAVFGAARAAVSLGLSHEKRRRPAQGQRLGMAAYRTHHLRRPGALKPFDAQTGAARALAS